VEEVKERDDAKPLERAPEQATSDWQRIRIDTYVGMGLSNLVALFIILTTAATLNAHGVTDIQTSSQAAEALRPIAGQFAFAIFAIGIIGTGMLALPVLAGSSAYALGETFGWHVGLARRPRRAKAFYGAIAVATLLGAGLNFSPIDPIKALFWSAVINGGGGRAGDGLHDAPVLPAQGHGRLLPVARPEDDGLAGDRGDDRSRRRPVRHLGQIEAASGPSRRTARSCGRRSTSGAEPGAVLRGVGHRPLVTVEVV